MLNLKLQYFGHLMRSANTLEKILVMGKIEGRRRRGQQRMRYLDGVTDMMDMSLSRHRELWWTGSPGMLQCMGSQRVRHDWVTELNWMSLSFREEGQWCLDIALEAHMCKTPLVRRRREWVAMEELVAGKSQDHICFFWQIVLLAMWDKVKMEEGGQSQNWCISLVQRLCERGSSRKNEKILEWIKKYLEGKINRAY